MILMSWPLQSFLLTVISVAGGRDGINRQWKLESTSGRECPSISNSSVDHSGKSLHEATQLVAHSNCMKRGNVPMCAFPAEGFENVAPVLLIDSVVNADKKLFQERILGGTDGPWLVMFYADWCPHCLGFAPMWTAAGLALQASSSHIRLAGVNCEANMAFCREQDLPGFPQIRWVYNGANLEMKATISAAAEKSYDAVEGAFVEEYLRNHTKKRQQKQVLERQDIVKQLRDSGRLPSRPNGEFTTMGSLTPGPKHIGYTSFFAALGSPTEAIAALSDSKANIRAQCPPLRDVKMSSSTEPASSVKPALDWVSTGWPKEESHASPKSRRAEAGYMLAYTLTHWVTPKATRGSSDLDAFQWQDLMHVGKLTSLLAKNFPDAQDELTLLNKAVQDARLAGNLCISSWRALIQPLIVRFGTTPPRGMIYCKTDTCRLWTLFHILTLAPAMGVAGALAPKATLEGIIDFIDQYFRCNHCRAHAMKQYKAGAYGRDSLLARQGANGLVIYMWRFHNAVSVRVAAEGGCDADRRWPPPDLCPSCWKASDEPWAVLTEAQQIFAQEKKEWHVLTGQPVEDNVLNFMKATFWGACFFDSKPASQHYWEPACADSADGAYLPGCNADGKQLECRFCGGSGDYKDILCPAAPITMPRPPLPSFESSALELCLAPWICALVVLLSH